VACARQQLAGCARNVRHLIFCCSQPWLLVLEKLACGLERCTSAGDGKCVICDSYVRPATLVRICDECNYGSYAGRCVICGGVGVSDAYYCKECTVQEKDVRDPVLSVRALLLLYRPAHVVLVLAAELAPKNGLICSGGRTACCVESLALLKSAVLTVVFSVNTEGRLSKDCELGQRKDGARPCFKRSSASACHA